MASRRKGRILAFQALYCWEAAKTAPGEILRFSWLGDKSLNLDKELSDFSRLLAMGTIENIDAVDAMIRSHLKNWDFSRLNRVDLAILRLSAYTLMFQADIAPSIAINEAIGISKEYGAVDSYRFVNGVLDSIRKTLEEKKTPCPEP
ncbi:MAG: transcription antitermination factor NusB [Treponema sp.]|jgi:N utilization substance protein B|nr:transcription antitermination factor NusB [Treponema sp.]